MPKNTASEPTEVPFAVQLAELVSDPDFLHLQALYDQPNFFRAVGRGFTETWHSAFLGWLLDPKGSHALGSFSLQCFLAMVAGAEIVPDETPAGICGPEELAAHIIALDFDDAQVLPCETNPQEFQIGKGGKVKGKIDVRVEVGGKEQKLVCLIEMKVNAKLSDGQTKRYAKYAQEQAAKKEGLSYACIFVARTEEIADTSKNTTDDERWFCIDYQAIHDRVLIPVLEHPNLNLTMRPLVEHYLRNLRWSDVNNDSLAMTKEEKKLADNIYKRYQEVFSRIASLLKKKDNLAHDVYRKYPKVFTRIATLLKEEDDFPEDFIPGKKEALPLIITLKDGGIIQGHKVRSFMTATLEVCKVRKVLSNLELPFATSEQANNKRYLISQNAIHPSGKSFTRALEFKNGEQALYIEINMSRASAIGQAKRLLTTLGVELA